MLQQRPDTLFYNGCPTLPGVGLIVLSFIDWFNALKFCMQWYTSKALFDHQLVKMLVYWLHQVSNVLLNKIFDFYSYKSLINWSYVKKFQFCNSSLKVFGNNSSKGAFWSAWLLSYFNDLNCLKQRYIALLVELLGSMDLVWKLGVLVLIIWTDSLVSRPSTESCFRLKTNKKHNNNLLDGKRFAYTNDSYSVLLQAGVSKLKPITRAMVFFLNDMTGRFSPKVFSEH